MDDAKRLQLIAEAVKYCQRAKKMGLPACCYSKALREPVHFLWERRIGASPHRVCGPKVCAERFRSKAARGLSFGKRKLVYDHAIPLNYLQDKLLKLSAVSPDAIRKLLTRLCVPVLITREENQIINRRGLAKRMPNGRNATGPLARYNAVGIAIVKNKCTSSLTTSGVLTGGT
jgi:hypothetical protein